MSSPDKQPSKALIVLPLLMLGMGAILQVYWLVVVGSVGLVGWYIDYSLAPTLRKRWDELLDAIRGGRQGGPLPVDSGASKKEPSSGTIFAGTIPGVGSAVPADQVQKTLSEWEAQQQKAEVTGEHDAALATERREHDDEKRQQEAREFLIRESDRVHKEQEEREAAKKREAEAEANRKGWIH